MIEVSQGIDMRPHGHRLAWAAKNMFNVTSNDIPGRVGAGILALRSRSNKNTLSGSEQ